MINDDLEKFTKAMKALAVNAGVQATRDIIDLYFEALKNFPIEQIESASKALLATWQYNRMPPLHTIIEEITGKRKLTQNPALVIANHIVSWLQAHGSTQYPPNLDSVADYLMRTRWPYEKWAASVLQSELMFWVRDFCNLYDTWTEIGTPRYLGLSRDIEAGDKEKLEDLIKKSVHDMNDMLEPDIRSPKRMKEDLIAAGHELEID